MVVGLLWESTRAQALQEVLDHLGFLRLPVAGVDGPCCVRHVRHVSDSSKSIKRCKQSNTVGVRGLAGFFVPLDDRGVTLELRATTSFREILVIQL